MESDYSKQPKRTSDWCEQKYRGILAPASSRGRVAFCCHPSCPACDHPHICDPQVATLAGYHVDKYNETMPAGNCCPSAFFKYIPECSVVGVAPCFMKTLTNEDDEYVSAGEEVGWDAYARTERYSYSNSTGMYSYDSDYKGVSSEIRNVQIQKPPSGVATSTIRYMPVDTNEIEKWSPYNKTYYWLPTSNFTPIINWSDWGTCSHNCYRYRHSTNNVK
eukprot:GHVR01110044.1.p2 GENE.GHVR01110044.1~~GHVR01110044.1.p2  ORF type:complete len:219 (+),score=12.98 GHVR01110044.1:508-1164(+)